MPFLLASESFTVLIEINNFTHENYLNPSYLQVQHAFCKQTNIFRPIMAPVQWQMLNLKPMCNYASSERL